MRRRKEMEIPHCPDIVWEMRSGLKKEESVVYDLSTSEIAEIIKKVSEDLIKQEAHLVPGLQSRVFRPEVTIKNGVLNAVVRTEMLKPVRVDFAFTYSYENSNDNPGKLLLTKLKMSVDIKSRFKTPVRAIINKMNIAEKTKDVLVDINQVLIELFPKGANNNGAELLNLGLEISEDSMLVIASA